MGNEEQRDGGGAARRPRVLDQVVLALFVAAISGPAVGALLRPGAAATSVEHEQRKPAPRPRIPRTPREAARFPRELKAWHDDRLGLRDVLLETRSRLLYRVFAISPTKSAVIGDDGWLWYAGESSIPAWRGSSPLRPAAVADWVRVFRDRQAWCAAHGIVYVATLVPNKFEVYPERVPPLYAPIGPSRYDQIDAALVAEPGAWYLDMRAELRDERARDSAEDFLYSRRGTHWTARGALRASAALMERARALGVEVEVPGPASFGLEPMGFDDDSWSKQLHMPDLAPEVQLVLVKNLSRRWRPADWIDAKPVRLETLTGDASLPRLWLVHDSFGVLLRMMLPPFFERTKCDWKGLGQLDAEALLAFAPDVVLDVHTERQVYLPPPDFVASADRTECARRYERAEPVWSLASSSGRVVVEPDASCLVENAELVIAARRAGAGVVIADVDVGVAGTPILLLDVEVAGSGSIYVQWQLRGGSGWRGAPVEERTVAPGAQTLLVEISDPDARGPIRISPEPSVGAVRVRRAELRSAGW